MLAPNANGCRGAADVRALEHQLQLQALSGAVGISAATVRRCDHGQCIAQTLAHWLSNGDSPHLPVLREDGGSVLLLQIWGWAKHGAYHRLKTCGFGLDIRRDSELDAFRFALAGPYGHGVTARKRVANSHKGNESRWAIHLVNQRSLVVRRRANKKKPNNGNAPDDCQSQKSQEPWQHTTYIAALFESWLFAVLGNALTRVGGLREFVGLSGVHVRLTSRGLDLSAGHAYSPPINEIGQVLEFQVAA
jgi:hypothetical protein